MTANYEKLMALEKIRVNKTSVTFEVIVCFRSFLFQLEDHKPLCCIVVRGTSRMRPGQGDMNHGAGYFMSF